jgi:prolyl-tRNA editing enzyme YbaK/EbsC (Cys-tRNA(Pro) deacylase)
MYIDRSSLTLDTIGVNGGRRGPNLRVPTADLIDITNTRPIDVHED